MKTMSKRLSAVLLACALTISSFVSVTATQTAPAKTTLSWEQFLGNETLRGVSDAKTPTSGDDLKKNWEVDLSTSASDWAATPGTPIVVGDYVYCYIKNQIHKIDSNTGEIVKSAEAPGKSMFFITIAYGDGKIFVPRESSDKNYVIAYDADTLEKLFETEAIPGAQLQSPVIYHDGYIYLGSRAGSPEYVCFSTEDTDPSTPDEVVEAAWSQAAPEGSLGFGWIGAAFKGDTCFFADASGTVYSVNAKTGALIDSFKLPNNETVTSTLNYYEKNNRLYISSNGGSAVVRSYEVNKDGSLNQDSMKMYNSGWSGGGTQSSPVIYNDRLYLGGGGGTMGSAEPFHVVDANTMQEIYTVEGLVTKGSAAITTAYATEENGNQVYAYLVPYAPQGDSSVMYILKDKENQTEPDVEIVQNVGEKQYCSQTMAIDKNGNLVFYNDAKKLYSFGRADEASRAVTGEDVEQQINRLPKVDSFEYYNEFEVKRIQERYNNLSDAEQAKVTSIQKLEDILAVSSQDPIERMEQGIASIPALDEITLDDQSKIQTLYTAYNNFSAEDQAKVSGADKLLAAYTRIAELRDEELVNSLIADIDALPAVEALTKAGDEASVSGLTARYNELSSALQEKVSNADKLEKAAARIEEITQQLEQVDALIKEKLQGVKLTMDNIGLIDEIDKAAEGLAQSDLETLSSYSGVFQPAKRTAVNLLIQNELMQDGKQITVTADNAAELTAVIEKIEGYYATLNEAQLRRVENYEVVAAVKADLEKLNASSNSSSSQGGSNNSGKLPVTGEAAGVLAGSVVLTAALCAAFVLRKRRGNNE